MRRPIATAGGRPASSGLLSVCRSLDAGIPPARRLAVLCLLVVAYIITAALSLVSPSAAVLGCAALVSAAAILTPRLGMMLLVVCVPIQWIFDISRAEMQIVLAAGLLSAAVRHLPLVARFAADKRPAIAGIVAALIAAIVSRTFLSVFVDPSAEIVHAAKEGVFFSSLFVVALASYAYAADRNFITGLLQASAAALAVVCLFDAAITYFPDWNAAFKLVMTWPGLRFSGLHINPNATAKYLLLGAALLGASYVAAPSARLRGVALMSLIAASLAVSATLSKSATVGILGALAIALSWAVLRRAWSRARPILVAFVAVFLTAATWEIALFPVMKDFTIHRYFESRKVPAPRVPPPSDDSMTVRLQKQLRIYESYEMRVERRDSGAHPRSEMFRNIEGQIVYSRRDCGLVCTGQRDRLWKAGADVVRQHWLFGIGSGAWPREFQERLQFPFDSPHNGVLELWGSHGLAGLVISVLLIAMLFRSVIKAFAMPSHDSRSVFALGISLYCLAILITELFDPAKFLTMNPHAVWLWIFVPALARILENSEPRSAGLRPE